MEAGRDESGGITVPESDNRFLDAVSQHSRASRGWGKGRSLGLGERAKWERDELGSGQIFDDQKGEFSI